MAMDKKLHDQGITNRKEVLGDEYVENALRQTYDFNLDLQEILNEYFLGKI